MTGRLVPVCIDLDGTLVKTDTLLESILLLVKKNPLFLVALFWWLRRGKVYFKREISRHTELPVAHLPYSASVLQYIEECRQQGHAVYLVTAAVPEVAEAVAKHLGVFAGVVTSDTVNLAGKAKAEALVTRFGPAGYVYAGNSIVDMPVWRSAAAGVVVNASTVTQRAAAQVTSVTLNIPRTPLSWQTLVRLIRSHQWVKNLLVFIPALAAHQVVMPTLWLSTGALAAFCLTASGVYVLNDLLDLTADRQHPTKRHRPLAAGEVPLMTGIALVPILFGTGIGLAAAISPALVLWLLLYVALTCVYSFYLKRLVVLDVVVLGFLYSLRIFAGGAASGVPVSQWLFVFSLFLFMSLALLKRYTELTRLTRTVHQSMVGRGYGVHHIVPIGVLGLVCGYVSVGVVAFYIQSPEVSVLYQQPAILWWLVPVIGAWISRVWWLAYTEAVHDDPVVFAMRDAISYGVLTISFIIVYLAA